MEKKKKTERKREGQMETYKTVAKEVYLAALEEDWERMIDAGKKSSGMYAMSPVTVSEDTPLHLAVYSKKDEPLKSLLRIANTISKANPKLGNPCTKKNAYGNTVLHEAVFAGNMKAVEHLLQGEYDPSMQLQTKNALGETPLYRAASCGKKEIVDYLAGQIPEGKLSEDHRKGEDSKPILHAAIQGHHFDTALTLLKLDPSLDKMKDNQGMTCLHVLAGIPSAFKSGYALRQITIKNLIYCCLSAAKGDGDQSRSEKAFYRGNSGKVTQESKFVHFSPKLNFCIFSGWPLVERIRKEKHKHESALELAKELIEKNQPEWWQSITVKPTKVNIETPGQGGRGGQSERQGGGGIPGGGREGQDGAREGAGEGGGGGEVENNENVQPKIEENRRQERPPSPPNPLFIATSNGIVEIAKEILDKFPQGIELVNDEGQNILHVAVMHRRRGIFRLVKKKNIIMTRMGSSVDNNGFTLLHQVAHVKHYSGGAKPGPALQLQEEIKWFKRVQRVVPPSLSEKQVQWVVPPSPSLSEQRVQLVVPPSLSEQRVQLVVPPSLSEQRVQWVVPPSLSEQRVQWVVPPSPSLSEQRVQLVVPPSPSLSEQRVQLVVPPSPSLSEQRVQWVVPPSLSEQRVQWVVPPSPSLSEQRVQWVVPPSLSEQRVQLVVPNDKNYKLMTAIELFEEEHKTQLKLAQDWIEKTSQSCSAVAVLLATVVFAAAYTIPGGSDDRGFPIFLHNRFFIAFTVLDVTALASSLTSVVMFLSILTTPFECEKFHHNIPRKLIWGFTLLFFSVMTTMLAFSCTLLLVIRLKKQWTTGLMSIAAFLPVTVFAGMQFPLYVAFMTTVKDFYKEVVKSLPYIHIPFRSHSRQGRKARIRW